MRNILLVVDNSNIHVHTKETFGADARFSYSSFECKFFSDDMIVAKQMTGSTPPSTDVFWNRMRQRGYEVTTYQRKRDRFRSYEKSVDTAIVAKATEAIINYRPDFLVLISGDLDMKPLVEMAKKYECNVMMWSYYQSSSNELENDCDEVYFIDDFLNELIYYQDKDGAIESYAKRAERLEQERLDSIERRKLAPGNVGHESLPPQKKQNENEEGVNCEEEVPLWAIITGGGFIVAGILFTGFKLLKNSGTMQNGICYYA